VFVISFSAHPSKRSQGQAKRSSLKTLDEALSGVLFGSKKKLRKQNLMGKDYPCEEVKIKFN
jgi:hypothetical protein